MVPHRVGEVLALGRGFYLSASGDAILAPDHRWQADPMQYRDGTADRLKHRMFK